jgi:hypothetical protein
METVKNNIKVEGIVLFTRRGENYKRYQTVVNLHLFPEGTWRRISLLLGTCSLGCVWYRVPTH